MADPTGTSLSTRTTTARTTLEAILRNPDASSEDRQLAALEYQTAQADYTAWQNARKNAANSVIGSSRTQS